MEYQLPDMKLAEPVDNELTEELEKMFADGKRKGNRKKKAKDPETSSSLLDDTLDATNDTDKVLSDVLAMEEDTEQDTNGCMTRSRKAKRKGVDKDVKQTTIKGGQKSIKAIKENKNKNKAGDDVDLTGHPKQIIPKSAVNNVQLTPENEVEITGQKLAHFRQTDFDQPVWIKERAVIMVPKSKRPKASPGCTHIVIPAQHDYALWTAIATDLSKCGADWNGMKNVISQYLEVLKVNVHVDSVLSVRLTWDKLDTMAHSLFPRDGPCDRIDSFQINTEAVGDCLPAAISRIVYGNQLHTAEMRLRMTVEAVSNEDWYLEDENLAIDLPYLDTERTISQKYVLFCGLQTCNLTSDIKTCYRGEVLRCFKAKQECALWQIHHMATVIRRPIISVFPEYNDVEDQSPLRFYHNRTIIPRLEEDRQNEPVTVMWTKSSPFSNMLANHFVPVVR